MKPIFDVLYEAKLVDKREFALCLGQNGGKFTIGGYDESIQANQEERVEWFPLNQPLSHYKIPLQKVKVGNLDFPNPPATGFVDSGTTFAYMSSAQKESIDNLIQQNCKSGEYKCHGTRVEKYCWKFNATKDGKKLSLKDHFASFPVLSFIHT